MVLENVRKNIRGQPIDVDRLNAYALKKGGTRMITDQFPKYIPNYILHPAQANIVLNGSLGSSLTALC